VADENNSCDLIGIAVAVHPNNVQGSPKLRLDPSKGPQRILRQSSRLLSSFAKKKCTDVNISNHSSHPMPKDDHYPNATLPNPNNSEHNARLTEILAIFDASEQDFRGILWGLKTPKQCIILQEDCVVGHPYIVVI
jgi:hypothetical protein